VVPCVCAPATALVVRFQSSAARTSSHLELVDS
jgi:hypothetical protein